MKRIIFRNPFVTKASLSASMELLKVARILIEESERFVKEGGGLIIDGVRLLSKASILMDRAARMVGFRNFMDYSEWIERHGKIRTID